MNDLNVMCRRRNFKYICVTVHSICPTLSNTWQRDDGNRFFWSIAINEK